MSITKQACKPSVTDMFTLQQLSHTKIFSGLPERNFFCILKVNKCRLCPLFLCICSVCLWNDKDLLFGAVSRLHNVTDGF